MNRIPRPISGAIVKALCLALMAGASPGRCQENYAEWPYSMKIRINTSASGAYVAGTVTGFPLLVRLNPAVFSDFKKTLPGGADIRFANAQGRPLPFEIERWVEGAADNDTAEIWVRCDTVRGNNGSQHITLYYGKTGVSGASSGAAVFDTAAGFVAVYHCRQSSGGAIPDATANGLAAAPAGNMPNQQPGPIGWAQSFDGHGDNFNAGDSPRFDLSRDDRLTIAAWINRTGDGPSADRYEIIASRFNWTDGTYREFEILNRRGEGLNFNLSSDGTDFTVGNETQLKSGIEPINGTWYHVAGVLDGDSMKIYVNGVRRNAAPKKGIFYSTRSDFIIAANSDPGQAFFGKIDEITLSRRSRGEDWIKLCYENQKAGQTLIDLDDYSRWRYSRKITLNTGSTGYAIQADVHDFPWLVRLCHGTFDFNQALRNGADLRFAKADGTPLRFQVNDYDSAAERASVWVKADTVFGNNSGQYIVMYWGYPAARNVADGAAVFDTTGGFTAIYHLDEFSGNAQDATANAFSAVRSGRLEKRQAGLIGYAQSFNGEDSYYNAGNNAAFNMPRGLTLSAWVCRRGSPLYSSWEGIAGKFVWVDGNFREYELENRYINGFSFHISENGNDAGEKVLFSEVKPVNDAWYHVAGRWDGSTMAIFVNGEQKNQSAMPGIFTSSRAPFRIGVADFGGGLLDQRQFFRGRIDEVQLSRVPRSADWIKLSYLNQKGDDAPPANLRYVPAEIVTTPDRFLDTIVPVFDGWVDSFTVSPRLNDYIVLHPLTGAISGWADDTASPKTFYIRAWNSRGFCEDTITLTVIKSGTLFRPAGGALAGARISGVRCSRASGKITLLLSVDSRSAAGDLRITAVNLSGRAVWSNTLPAALLRNGSCGVETCSLPAGVCLIQLHARSATGKLRVVQTVKLPNLF